MLTDNVRNFAKERGKVIALRKMNESPASQILLWQLGHRTAVPEEEQEPDGGPTSGMGKRAVTSKLNKNFDIDATMEALSKHEDAIKVCMAPYEDPEMHVVFTIYGEGKVGNADILAGTTGPIYRVSQLARGMTVPPFHGRPVDMEVVYYKDKNHKADLGLVGQRIRWPPGKAPQTKVRPRPVILPMINVQSRPDAGSEPMAPGSQE